MSIAKQGRVCFNLVVINNLFCLVELMAKETTMKKHSTMERVAGIDWSGPVGIWGHREALSLVKSKLKFALLPLFLFAPRGFFTFEKNRPKSLLLFF